MCEVNPCQAGGVCAANFFTGDVCRCPTGREGLFCERASNGESHMNGMHRFNQLPCQDCCQLSFGVKFTVLASECDKH